MPSSRIQLADSRIGQIKGGKVFKNDGIGESSGSGGTNFVLRPIPVSLIDEDMVMQPMPWPRLDRDRCNSA